MSISVHSNSENILFNGYSYFFEASDSTEKFYFNYPLHEGFSTYRFSSFATLPCYPDNGHITINDCKYASLDWQSGTSTDKIAKDSNTLGDRCLNSCNRGYNGDKPMIWRPFSPQEDAAAENTVLKRSTRTNTRNTFHSIKPSNVKIGPSKSSVFKAVKKNTFACTQCSSRYMSNRQLNSHMRVHTGSKPFVCEFQNCYKSFARNEELTRHKRIHSGFKPHQCITCKKRFGRKDHLSKHLKTHLQTSEKKVYQCSFPGCGHRYTRSDALTRHKSTAHAIKSHKDIRKNS